MNQNQEDKLENNKIQIPSPIRDAGARGIYFGLYLSFVYGLFIASYYYPILGFVYFVALLITPFVAYRFTKAYRDQYFPQEVEFRYVVAWAHSTWLYLFGSIVLLLPAYYFHSRVLPTILPELEEFLKIFANANQGMWQLLTESIGKSPIDALREYASTDLLLSKLLSLVNNTFIFGGLVSAITSFILRRKIVK